jgi:hypothetical protein
MSIRNYVPECRLYYLNYPHRGGQGPDVSIRGVYTQGAIVGDQSMAGFHLPIPTAASALSCDRRLRANIYNCLNVHDAVFLRSCMLDEDEMANNELSKLRLTVQYIS